MKRIISLILSVVMIMGMISISASAETEKTALDSAEKFAFALNVVNSESYQPNKLVTRAEFAELVYRLLNFADITDDENNWYNDNYGEDTKDELQVLTDTKIFEDVDKAVPQYNAIKYVSSMGLMNGMTSEFFGPSYDITVASVAKVMVNILGYEEVALNKGGYPNGYMTVASSLKLLSGVNAAANEFITMEDCLDIFYNALDVKMFDLEYISGDGEAILTKGKESFLTKGLGLVNVNGIVEDTGITTMYSSSDVGEEMAVIGGTKMYVGDCTEVRSYIGREVDAYCLVNDSTYTLRFIEPTDDRSITISSDDFVSYKDGEIEYEDESGKLKTADMVSKSKIKVVYNGKAIKQYTADIFSFPYGDITLISTTGGKYDLVVIRDYAVGKVAKVRAEENYVYSETLYTKMSPVKHLELDKDDKFVSIKDANGKEMDISAINPGDVVSAMISADGEYVEVIISNAEIAGFVVDSISETDSDILYTNGDAEYALTHKDKLTNVPAVKPNKAYNMYFDHEGRLVYIDSVGEDTAGEKAAFITGVDSLSDGFNSDYKIRMYTEDGLMVIYDFEDRVILNGDSQKIEDAIADIRAAADKQKAVLYEADTKTKIIKSITLPLEFGAPDRENRGWYHISPDGAKLSRGDNDTDDAWNDNNEKYKLQWFINGNSFNKVVFWNKTFTKSMNVPEKVSGYEDERDFSVVTGSQFFGDGYGDAKYYLLHAYSRDRKAMEADLIVYASSTKQTAAVVTTEFFVVEKISKALGRDEEEITQITGYEVVLSPSSCKKVSYMVDEDTTFLKSNNKDEIKGDYDINTVGPGKPEELGVGDVLRINADSSGVIKSIVVNYDASNKKALLRTAEKNPFPESQMNMNIGYPLYVTGTCVRLSYIDYLPEEMENQSSENLMDHTKLLAHNVGTRPVLVVEKQGTKTTVSQGTIDDILTYEDTGVLPDYDIVVGLLYGGQTIGTVVYKRAE